MSDETMALGVSSGLYRHYKGGLYSVVGVAKHTETGETLVIYIPVGTPDHGSCEKEYFARPLSVWLEHVMNKEGNAVPRFVRLQT